jgi:hypothetical protein
MSDFQNSNACDSQIPGLYQFQLDDCFSTPPSVFQAAPLQAAPPAATPVQSAPVEAAAVQLVQKLISPEAGRAGGKAANWEP